jgi:hypothetical protein
MSSEDRAALERAFGYPYEVPAFSFVYDAGFTAPPESADFEGRTPVVAYGSNAAPDQLIRKFGTEEGVRIPVTRATLRGLDVVFAAGFASYGSVPATLHRSEGTEAFVHVTWLTPEQLRRMHETEGAGKVYSFGTLAPGVVTLRDAPPVEPVHVYVAAAGAVGPEPVALESVPAKGRLYDAVSQPAILRMVRDRLAPEEDLSQFVLATVRDPELRAARSAALREGAVSFDVAGFTPLV